MWTALFITLISFWYRLLENLANRKSSFDIEKRHLRAHAAFIPKSYNIYLN